MAPSSPFPSVRAWLPYLHLTWHHGPPTLVSAPRTPVASLVTHGPTFEFSKSMSITSTPAWHSLPSGAPSLPQSSVSYFCSQPLNSLQCPNQLQPTPALLGNLAPQGQPGPHDPSVPRPSSLPLPRCHPRPSQQRPPLGPRAAPSPVLTRPSQHR